MPNILGFNTLNLLIVFLIMLVVAGPRRMINWAYISGKYLSQLRKMVNETMKTVHQEIQAADPELAKDLTKLASARFDIVSEANKIINLEEPQNTTPPASAASTPVTDTAPANNGATAGTTPDDEKPRYDAWLPK